jgi:hypothetical protein
VVDVAAGALAGVACVREVGIQVGKREGKERNSLDGISESLGSWARDEAGAVEG